MLSNVSRKNDAFLVLLLVFSLSLNVYLGWTIKRLKASSPVPQNAVRLEPGMTVQPVTAVTLSGAPEVISYAEYDKPTVFYVFSPSCIWCERNTQNINTIAKTKAESFRFIGLSLAADDLYPYVESHQFSFPVYKNLPLESIQMLGLGSTPQTIIISPDGRVLKNWIGAFGSNLQPQIEEFFNIQLPGLTEQSK